MGLSEQQLTDWLDGFSDDTPRNRLYFVEATVRMRQQSGKRHFGLSALFPGYRCSTVYFEEPDIYNNYWAFFDQLERPFIFPGETGLAQIKFLGTDRLGQLLRPETTFEVTAGGWILATGRVTAVYGSLSTRE
jgi:hypothetical protein